MSAPPLSPASISTTDPAWPFGPLLGFDTETTGVDPGRDRYLRAVR